MSLLSFIRRGREERKAAAVVEPPPSSPAPAAPLTRIPPVEQAPAAPANTDSQLDLDRIRRELEEIARIIGSEDNVSGSAPANEIAIEIKLADIIRLSRESFKDPDSLTKSLETVLSVTVPRLFDQLSTGKVVTKLSYLVADVPPDYLSSYAQDRRDQDVSLPLALVVAAVQPGELRKRTTAVERDLGEKSLPNLFGPSIPTSVEEVAAVETAGVSPAPEPEPAAASAEVVESIAAESVEAVVETVAEQAEPEVVFEMPASEPVAETIAEIVATDPVVAETGPVEAASEVTDAEPVFEIEPEPAAQVEPAAPVAEHAPMEIVAEAAPQEIEQEQAIGPAEAAAPAPETADVPAAEIAAEFEKVLEEEEDAVESMQPSAPQQVDAPAAEVPGPVGAAADDLAPSVMLAGLDVNKASAEEMTQRWNGVGLRLARKIVEVRETTGLFEDLYDLARVPSLRSQRFEQVTGLPWNAAYFKYRDMANEIIGSPKGEIPDIKQLAERFSQVSGFAGCMVIHEDGLVLAGKWDHPSANALGAFAPQMFKKIHKYVKPLRLGEMKAICFFVGHQPITVIHSSPIYFAAMHEADRLSKKQVAIAQALTIELGRRFSKSA